MDNIHFFQRPMVARDIEDPAALDLNTVYAAVKGTTKHVGTSFTEALHFAPALSMLHDIAGGEDKWRVRPFVSNSNCFVVPPLRFATESCQVMEEAVKAGMPDSKIPDAQSGYEKGSTLVMAGLSGLNMVYEAAGMHASLLGFCLESLIIDNDMLGQCLRCVRGIEVNDQTIGIQVMKDVCMGGAGHYLGHDQTIGLMQMEYIYHELSDRSSPKEWEELGKPNLVAEAVKRKNQILSEFVPQHIPEELDARIRANYDIRLG